MLSKRRRVESASACIRSSTFCSGLLALIVTGVLYIFALTNMNPADYALHHIRIYEYERNTQMKTVAALKAHLAINVRNVETSIEFYKKLFGVEPAKVRSG